MSAAFDQIDGQERVCSYLQHALDAGRITHAYLLVGAEASPKEEIALRFAASLIADGDEDQRSVALRLVHPDLRVMEPGGAGGYLVEQVRDLVHDAGLAPIRAPRKVFILTQADLLMGAPANALLKTLEEPPSHVVCILLASSEESVLETLRSRCEVLVCDEVSARSSGDVEAFAMLTALSKGCSMRTLLQQARRFTDMSHRGTEELERQQAAQLEADRDFLSPAAMRDLEKQHRRLVSMSQREELSAQLALVRGWLRDCLVVAQGAPELVVYRECADQTMSVATGCALAGILTALSAVDSCSERISCNVTPQLAVEAMFMDIREALCPQ